MGKITLVNDGLDLDVFWDELTEEYPNLFDEDILGSEERLERILEVRDKFSPKEESVFENQEEKEKALVKLKNEIIETFYDIPEGDGGTKYVFYDKSSTGLKKELEKTEEKLNLKTKEGIRKSIDSDFNYLYQLINNPTNDRHVPQDMRAEVAYLLECFKFETKKIDKLRAEGKEIDELTSYTYGQKNKN